MNLIMLAGRDVRVTGLVHIRWPGGICTVPIMVQYLAKEKNRIRMIYSRSICPMNETFDVYLAGLSPICISPAA